MGKAPLDPISLDPTPNHAASSVLCLIDTYFYPLSSHDVDKKNILFYLIK